MCACRTTLRLCGGLSALWIVSGPCLSGSPLALRNTEERRFARFRTSCFIWVKDLRPWRWVCPRHACRCSPCNSALFADIVPVQLRSTIYAFDRSFEGAVAACGAPLVGLIAERAGFLESGELTGAGTARNADALAHSLLLCLTVPWVLCFLFYGVLHFTYPRDRLTKASDDRLI